MTSAYEELAGSPRESIGEGGGNGSERWFVTTWGNRLTLAADLAYKEHHALADCWAQQIEINPQSNDIAPDVLAINDVESAGNVYTWNGAPAALLRVSYGPNFTSKAWPTDITKPTPRAGTVLRLRIRGSGQFLTFPVRGAQWQAAADQSPGDVTANGERAAPPPNLNARILRPVADFSIQWDYVDDPPVDALDALLGSTNDDVYLGTEAETLLFDSYDIDDAFKCDPTAPHTHRININVRKRKVIDPGDGTVYGWNHDFNEDEGEFDKILMADGNPRYRLEDWSNFFA